MGKNSFAHFWKIKMNINKKNFKFSFCILFLDVLGRCLKVFKKILIFKVPVIFLKLKTLPRVRRARAAKIANFWN